MGAMKNALIEIGDALLYGDWAKACELANNFGDEAERAMYQAVAMLRDTTE